jgi:hypothetical protein
MHEKCCQNQPKIEGIAITNPLAYSATVVITTVKSCTVQPPRTDHSHSKVSPLI